MNKYFCHVQDVALLRIVVLQRLGILRMVYRRFVSDLNWPVYYCWVMDQPSDGSHESGSNYIDPLSAPIYRLVETFYNYYYISYLIKYYK